MNQKEERKVYYLNLVLNYRQISKVTITEHYKINHPNINDQLILELLKMLNGIEIDPRRNHNGREIYLWDKIVYQGKRYRLIFWFGDNETNHLWIRNCYRID